MKRKVALLAAAAALGVAIVVGSRLVAQQPIQQATATAPAQPLRSRIGLVNLPHVIKSYQKYQAFEREWAELYKQFDKTYEGKRALLVQYQSDLQKQTQQAEKDRFESAIRNLQREMQDMGEDAKKQLGKKQNDQAVIIYLEIEEAVKAYARANDLELVLQYNEAVVPADLTSPPNVQRKLQLGALFPMYSANGMDITNWIITMLNQRYSQMMSQPAPGGAAPGQPRN